MAEGVAFIELTRSDGTILLQSSLPGAAGDNGLVWVETRDLDFGSKNLKYIDQIILHIDGAADFISAQLFYGIKDRINDALTWSSGYSIVSVDEPIFIRVTTRFIRVRISDFQPASRWKLTNISFYGKVMGKGL